MTRWSIALLTIAIPLFAPGGTATGATALQGAEVQPADLRARYERAVGLLPWNLKSAVPGLEAKLPWDTAGDAEGDPTTSPGGRWRVQVADGNLLVVEVASGKSRQLTNDAAADHFYALPADSDLRSILRRRGKDHATPTVVWSPDGARFATCHVDQRGLRQIPTVINIQPGQEHQIPYVHYVNTSMPGDEKVPTCQLVVFEPTSARRVELAIPPLMLAYGPLPFGELQWNASGTRLYATHETRDFKTLTVYEADTTTGKARAVALDRSELPLRQDPPVVASPVGDGAQIVLYSERDGWGHYYLYDTATGQLRNQITRGEWVVRQIEHIDARRGWLYFTASGREPGRDLYYAHLYRVHLNGTGLELLTPEDAQHDVSFAPDGHSFVDTYSTVSQPPVTVLRRTDGRKIRELGRADMSSLVTRGWKSPERVRVKADDGQTDLYGTLYFPFDFDPARSYPIVDSIYGGPQTTWAPVRFLEDREEELAMAQLGFIVLILDARGTPWRSQAFQDVEFGTNFGSPAIVADHIAAIRQLAQRHSYIDAERAGMYGYSWGGYRTARAMFQFPDFFKVGVAAAGSHDNFNYIFEHDRWFGMARDYPDTYTLQSNLPLAGNLKGRLLLAHGDVDDDVHVANTLQLTDALIRANRPFDLFIYPDRSHEDMYHDGYFIRRKWDYFVRHLLGAAPPADFRIESAPH